MMDVLSTDDDVEDIVSEKDTQNVLKERIKAFKTTLNEKEACILDHRLMAEEPRTLQQLGARLDISRERVRQIEQRILKKARASFNGDLVKLDVWPACDNQETPKSSMTAHTG
jgi:RNA polymerase sigma-32 factor